MLLRFLNELELIYLYTVKWFQALLFNTNDSSQHYLFVCSQVNGFKYYNLILTIQYNVNQLLALKLIILSTLFIRLHSLKWFNPLLFNTNNSCQHYSFLLLTGKWLQVLLCNTNNSAHLVVFKISVCRDPNTQLHLQRPKIQLSTSTQC